MAHATQNKEKLTEALSFPLVHELRYAFFSFRGSHGESEYLTTTVVSPYRLHSYLAAG